MKFIERNMLGGGSVLRLQDFRYMTTSEKKSFLEVIQSGLLPRLLQGEFVARVVAVLEEKSIEDPAEIINPVVLCKYLKKHATHDLNEEAIQAFMEFAMNVYAVKDLKRFSLYLGLCALRDLIVNRSFIPKVAVFNVLKIKIKDAIYHGELTHILPGSLLPDGSKSYQEMYDYFDRWYLTHREEVIKKYTPEELLDLEEFIRLLDGLISLRRSHDRSHTLEKSA